MRLYAVRQLLLGDTFPQTICKYTFVTLKKKSGVSMSHFGCQKCRWVRLIELCSSPHLSHTQNNRIFHCLFLNISFECEFQFQAWCYFFTTKLLLLEFLRPQCCVASCYQGEQLSISRFTEEENVNRRKTLPIDIKSRQPYSPAVGCWAAIGLCCITYASHQPWERPPNVWKLLQYHMHLMWPPSTRCNNDTAC